MKKQEVKNHTYKLTELVSHHYCECGRERSVLEKEFGPELIGHLVHCAACGGTAHHCGEHTVCLKCGRYEETGSIDSDNLTGIRPVPARLADTP